VASGIDANAEALARVMRTCASVEILTDPCLFNMSGMFKRDMSESALAIQLSHDHLHAIRKVVDVGGGFGHMVVALLEKYPGSGACCWTSRT
jgi:16S rRNA G1207 methylase RsmC